LKIEPTFVFHITVVFYQSLSANSVFYASLITSVLSVEISFNVINCYCTLLFLLLSWVIKTIIHKNASLVFGISQTQIIRCSL